MKRIGEARRKRAVATAAGGIDPSFISRSPTGNITPQHTIAAAAQSHAATAPPRAGRAAGEGRAGEEVCTGAGF